MCVRIEVVVFAGHLGVGGSGVLALLGDARRDDGAVRQRGRGLGGWSAIGAVHRCGAIHLAHLHHSLINRLVEFHRFDMSPNARAKNALSPAKFPYVLLKNIEQINFFTIAGENLKSKLPNFNKS
jgi:hypothetical protein